MKKLLLAAAGLFVSCAEAAPGYDYQGRCQVATFNPVPKVTFDGKCTINGGPIPGSDVPGYKGILVLYTVRTVAGATYDVRVWGDGFITVNGVPGRQTPKKLDPLEFRTVEDNGLRITPPPANPR